MRNVRQYHAISLSGYDDGSVEVRHARLDEKTRKLVHELLDAPDPVASGPWSWEEMLLIGVCELLVRRLEGEPPLF